MKHKHFKNFGNLSEIVFITTTCLDFAPLLNTSERKTKMTQTLLSVCKKYQASLHAFVIMPEHINLICRLPDNHNASWFVARIKSASGLWLKVDLTDNDKEKLSHQSSLNSRTIWKRSFRSLVIENEAVLRQKENYIHENPVRRGYAEKTIDYPWSSAFEFECVEWNDEFEMPCENVLSRLSSKSPPASPWVET